MVLRIVRLAVWGVLEQTMAVLKTAIVVAIVVAAVTGGMAVAAGTVDVATGMMAAVAGVVDVAGVVTVFT